MDQLAFQLNLGGKLMDLSTPKVMGIINITPDSFYSFSRLLNQQNVLEKVEKALTEGASIIDVGAYSTRPSATPIGGVEELERLKAPLRSIRKHFPEAVLSVDTFRSNVAQWAIDECGVEIINDVSGGTLDNFMFQTVASADAAYVLTHMRGTPQTMQQLTSYDDMMAEILAFFQKRIAQLVQLGAKNVILDPGFGFAKTLEQNYELMAKMNYFRQLELPVLVGISRKSMIYNLLANSPEEALNGTTALNMLSLMNGANILRVHDVKEAVETIKIFERYKTYQP